MSTARLGVSLTVLVVAVAGACNGTHKEAASPSAGASASSQTPIPAWAGPYTPDQLRLMAEPLESPVEHVAPRVYPDLSRFTFLGEAPINVPGDPTSYWNLVSQTLEQSNYLYVFRSGAQPPSNPRALFGPDPNPVPDPWVRATAGSGGQLQLVESRPTGEAKAQVDKAATANPAEAMALLTQAAAASADVPGVQVALADAALASGDMAVAEKAANEAIKIDPNFPTAHRALAEIALRKSDKERAKQHIAKALALYPAAKRAWQVADAIMGREIVREVSTPLPFVEVNDAGAILVISCDRPMCEGYAACKAAFRYEPQFRSAVLGEPASTPYHLSVTEEVACLESGLGAHLASKNEQSQAVRPDPTAELLMRLAREKGLTGYALFELIGRQRPEWLRVAPAAVHDAVLAYVIQRVFGRPTDPLPPGQATPGSVITTERRIEEQQRTARIGAR